jgi:uncharacterized protein (DUF305 family)
VQRYVVHAVVAAVAAVAIGGCSSEEPPRAESTAPVVQLGAPGEPNRTLSPEELSAMTAPTYVEQDVTFVRHMLYHHEQAMEMTAMVDERAGSDRVKLLAERMTISQESEMEQMQQWLAQRDESLRDPRDPDHSHAARTMPGLITDEQMTTLEAARGEEFDRLFLESMIVHHQGAITMVEELYDAGGGLESEIDSIARHVVADQGIEISRMQGMLAEMGS